MKKHFSQLMTAAAIVMASLAGTSAAMAHGAAEPAHGGVVQTASDLSFELVATGDGAAIYIVNHDEDADASKFGGKVTVLNGTEKTEAPLASAGGNKLEAKGVKVVKGTKVVALITTHSKKTVTVRFTVK
ncbi:hypothetical protein M5C96_12440 [Acidovorax sp. GBBC 1281]|uniref:hypothetical protein n=1 Tax=Acidovorax sp. SUPP2522 TaxID=511900 RepID=UPI00234AC60B|nr:MULTISPECIES: hypothetical protein [unclassified Acidovorax]WCN00390.1 hypothetical protein M5C96_12440 [Acidovorax sp. GBBC 1281]